MKSPSEAKLRSGFSKNKKISVLLSFLGYFTILSAIAL